ncbi:hypothetical protein [Alkalicoccus daliensis]|uniref:ComG operon protein 7 n=1 Tax=Alkalicoccus daliensis TaxID=745820 RepID=A0A1H0B6L6_9BACI|nr:hypothetical protein [Alkalicoccus daliensis]SDN41266.1 hypothetical protein SAMN04488053_101774 [Alkalicoccus daliensis]
MKHRQSGFILLYSMLLVLCLSGLAFYIIYDYEMDRKLLTFELEKIQVNQLIFTEVKNIIRQFPDTQDYEVSYENTAFGYVHREISKNEKEWEVSLNLVRDGYTKQIFFIYNEEIKEIISWREGNA